MRFFTLDVLPRVAMRLFCGMLPGLLCVAFVWWLSPLTPATSRAASAAPDSTYPVNSTSDLGDDNLSDNLCEASPGICTLRAAIQQANAHPGPDVIQLQPGTTYLLSQIAHNGFITAGLIITDPVTILGAGANSTIIDGNAVTLHARVFNLTSTVIISGITIQHGFSPNVAGGIYNTGRLTLINSTVYSNTASGLNDWGGGIYNAGPLTLTNSIIRENRTGNHNAYGGGIYNQAEMLIISSTISNNSTFAGASSPGQGGGLFNIGYTSTIIASTINGNVAALGGGIYKGGYPLYIVNSTISGNGSNGNGGGIYNSSGTTSLFNATVTENIANEDGVGSGIGGGVYNAAGTFNFINSIIALNNYVIDQGQFDILDYNDCANTLTSQGYNILYTINPGCAVLGAYTLTNPLIDYALQNNGGSTWTHALLAGSPAIDAGNPSGCTDQFGALIRTDQRGQKRPAVGGLGKCDIGAFEFAYPLYLPLIRR